VDHVGAFRYLACHLCTDRRYEHLQHIYVLNVSVRKPLRGTYRAIKLCKSARSSAHCCRCRKRNTPRFAYTGFLFSPTTAS
jgi:hypothetical protein